MKTQRALITLIIGLFFILDRFFKWQALHGWTGDRLINRWLGWHPFLNPGVAFGIPVPNWLIIGFTIPVIILILFVVLNQESGSEDVRCGQSPHDS